MGLPIVPMGLAYDRPWRLKSWDRFAVPRPFSRARAVIGPEIHIPPELDRRGIELHRVGVEQLLNDLTGEAERWAEGGYRRAGEFVAQRQSRILGPLGEWSGERPAEQVVRSAEELRRAG
jgi:hypothetical protein